MPLGAGPLTRAKFPSEMEVGLKEAIYNQYELRTREYETIYNMESSKKRQETYSVIAGAGTYPIKTEGNPPYIDTMEEAYTKQFIHDTYAMALVITWEARRDNLYQQVLQLGEELSRSAGYTQAVNALDPFNNPTSTSPGLYTAEGTAYPLLSTTHFLKTGSTWSNRFAVATTLDVVSLEAAQIAFMTNMVDQRGRKVNITPKWLMVGPDNVMVAHRLLDTTRGRPGGQLNDVNPTKNVNPGLEPLVMQHLAQTGAWFLVGAKAQTKFVYFERETFDSATETPGDGSRNMIQTGYYRCSYGSPTPLGVFGSPGS